MTSSCRQTQKRLSRDLKKILPKIKFLKSKINRCWPKARLASISVDIDVVSASTLWTPTLSPASSDVDANFSDLHALQTRNPGSKPPQPLGSCPQRLIRPPAASRSLLDHRGRHPRPRIALELAQEPGGRPSWRLVGNLLGQPKDSFTKPFDPFGVYLKGKYPTHSVHPWLQEAGVAERRLVRTSRDVTSGRSSRPQHHKVLYFPLRRLWIMEYSCKMQAHTQAALQAQLEAQFVRLFRAKFVPEHVQDRMEQEFLSLAQGSMTVLEYEARFSELSKYAPHIMADERRKTKNFVIGLKPSLRMRLVAFDHRTLDEALSAACRQEEEMEQYLEEKKALQKRPATTFQRQDKKKEVYQTPQRSVTVGSYQVPSVHSPGVKKECPHCGKTHGGTECWMIKGKCLKCGSSDHKIKDCPRLQQGAQRGAPSPAVKTAQQLSIAAWLAVDSHFSGQFRSPTGASFGRSSWVPFHSNSI
ncbi:hypothetical protein Taro_000213 [Colocasia esculenta]|uniref:CCHC-type domain-containing protein n=1 Tax=Colocasia esculenta TaxID=4460 RepID=A0A843T754_COLES|nr:hypothetical protein [Colocasia esculenta]